MAGSALQIGKTIQYDVTVWLDAVFVAKVVQQDIAVPSNAAVNICKVVQYLVVTDQLVSPPQIIHMA